MAKPDRTTPPPSAPARRRRILAALLAILLAPIAASAADLRIGTPADVTSLDPHFLNITPNLEISQHIFQALVAWDNDLQITPDLATAWRLITPTLWEFDLRPGVRFHDGSPFTADDVVFSIARARAVPNAIGSWPQWLRLVKTVTAVNPQTVRIETTAPDPLLLFNLRHVWILPHAAANGATTEDFNGGRAMIGTGPYRFVDRSPGERIVLARAETFDGPPQPWDRVVIRPIPNPGARTAALLSGDVDLIAGVNGADIPLLRGRPAITVVQRNSIRLIYLGLDSSRPTSPFVTDLQGKPLPNNPLQDQRVRRALSLAIDRAAIVARVMEGQATIATRLGTDPAFTPESYATNPARARALLAEAGYPNGFAITLHAPNDRYLNDAAVAQAVGQMWTRIGVRNTVEPAPRAVYFSRAAKFELSAMLLGAASASGEATSLMKGLLHTNDPARLMGDLNWWRFTDPATDALIEQAAELFDRATREALLKQALDRAVGEQVGLIPLHIETNTWAMRTPIVFPGRTDERTMATDIRPAP